MEKNKMQSNFIEFEFGKLHYQHSMTGKAQTILFLHAVHSSSAAYLEVCNLLKDEFNLICLDFPGHGLSDHVDIEKHHWYYSMDGFTALLIKFIEHLKLENLYIVGDSIGGNTAIRAMHALKMLRGLVLMGSAQAKTKEELFSLHYQTAPMNLLFQKELTDEECNILAAATVDPIKKEQKGFNQMLHDIRQTDPNYRECLANSIENQIWVNELELIQKYRLPLIYILGLDDGFINTLHYKSVLLESGMQESQIYLLSQTRHVPAIDSPDISAKLILEFINRN